MSGLGWFWRRFFVSAILAGCYAFVYPVTLEGQQDLFQRANQHYQAEEYDAAIELYEAILDGGFTSHDLHYNLGNAYFKAGDLGRAVLNWERVLRAEPGDEDARANLELARTLTVDNVEPLPRFWLTSVWEWWVRRLPGTLLAGLATGGWVALCGGLVVGVMARTDRVRSGARWAAIAGTALTVVFGGTLLSRELGVGIADRGVILATEVPVRSAPSNDDNLTVFQVHEGTRVRIDQRTDTWAEIVLDDGKVGWVPADALGEV